MVDYIIKYTDVNQNWLELLDGILLSIYIAVHCSTKYTLFCMMYNRGPVTPFKLAFNHRDGSTVPLSLSGESVTTDDHFTQMEHIYRGQCLQKPMPV